MSGADHPRVTFFTLPIQGHVGAAMPVVRALVERGAQVEVHTSEAFRVGFEAAGAQVVEYPAGGFAEVEAPSANFLTVAATLARMTRESMLEVATQALRDRPADVILVDSMAPWGLLAARRLGIPVATSTSSFVVHGGLGASPRAALDIVRRLPAGLAALGSITRSRIALRRRAGTSVGGPIRLLSNRGDTTIAYTSRALQPGAGRFGRDVAFVGATLAHARAPAMPGCLSRERSDAEAHQDPAAARVADHAALLDAIGPRPLAYVSLGTLYNDRPAFYRACVEALARPDRPLVLAVGGRVDPGSLGPFPSNVHVVAHAPQLALLARAELFVTHGGLNSVHESLWHGVPMVVFPQAADQPIVGDRLARLGAARVLRRRNPGAAQIRVAAEAVLAGGRAARQARALGQTLRLGGGAEAAAALVLELVAAS